MLRPFFVVLIIVLAATPVFSQNGDEGLEAIRQQKVVTAIRISDEISIDGKLDEPAWQLAVPATDFIQWNPRNGAAATEPTEVRFLYDDANLYVGFTFFDSQPEHVVVNDLKEDFNSNATDSVSLYIDSLHDRRSGFSFTTNAAGAIRDAQISNDGQLNLDWDGVWYVQGSTTEQGWIAEYKVPFKTLRFKDAPVQEWGVNMTRRHMRLNEESNWTPIPTRFRSTRVSLAGTLKGIENIRQGRNLYVKPFVIGGVSQVRNTRLDQLETRRSLSRFKDYDGGVDLKYGLTQQVTLDVTYRTDFAQVEADTQQVNLTRFNLFFPEKRDFFLENAGTFSFGPGGNLVPFFSRAIGLSGGAPVPIIGGARVSGKVSDYDIGFLSMKTEEVLEPGVLGYTPSNNFAVGRLKRNLFRNSWVGTLFTHRDSTIGGDYNRVYGTDAHFQFYQRLEFDTYVLKSDTPGRAGQNLARRFQTAWRDDEFNIGVEYNQVQANFNPETGFVRRGNMTQYAGDVAWRPQFTESDVIRTLNFTANLDYFGGAASGKVETRTQDAGFGISFDNNSSVNFSLSRTFDRLVTPFAIRSSASIPAGDYNYLRYSANFSTSPARMISGNGNTSWGEFWNGHSRSFGGGTIMKFSRHLAVDMNFSRNQVELPIPNGVFTTNLMSTRAVYAFTARAFLNAFVQYNADTHQLSSNIRFNIAHRPLSDIFLVYNDRRDLRTHRLQERAFIIKVTNLFNF
jgi:hypothetical protein